MKDFEKLGAFYLGKKLDAGAEQPRDELLLYDSKDLTTHAVCVGMTGSGKTGLCVTLLEEAAIDGVPAIVIDPKGDLGNLALTFPELGATDFAPYVDPGDATRKGRTPDEHAKATAALWKKGLGQWGQDGARIQRLRDAAEVVIYTPGSQTGRPLSALRALTAPGEAVLDDPDAMREQVMAAVSSLLALLGVEADPIRSREHILLSNILYSEWSAGRDVALGELIRLIQTPPFTRVGVMELDDFFPSADRATLAMGINNILASPGFSAWMEGEPLDVARLLHRADGKPRISILSISHLDDAQRMFFVTLLLNEVVSWMRSQTGTSSLRAILYMDEVFGFLPPVANPPSKAPMLTLLKQARAFGLGVMLATQNPVDVDYKALSNCGTWFLGRLQTERDVARVLDGLTGAATASGQGFDRGAMEATLAGLRSRVFLLNNVHDDAPQLFHTRWAMSYLRGPLSRTQIRALSKAGLEEEAALPSAPGAPVASAMTTAAITGAAATTGVGGAPAGPHGEEPTEPELAAPDTARPLVPEGVTELFLGGSPGCTYRPALIATVNLHYGHRYSGLDKWVEPTLIVRELTGESATAWRGAELFSASQLPLWDAPAPDARFEELPSGLATTKRMKAVTKSLKSFVYQNQVMPVFRYEALRMWSAAGEDRAAFTARARHAYREKRDLAMEKLRRRFTPKLARLEERIRKAEQKVEREKGQVSQQKMNTAVNVGTTMLGALFGSRSVARAGSAVRSAGRISQEQQQVQQAEANVQRLNQQLEELEAEFQDAMADHEAETAASAPEITEVLVRPKKADIQVLRLGLLWLQA